ncbi:ComEC/Rec2 family competence protein [Mangrovimonas sp. DI 80]|uniref:ComEC/Rec2 family competence protein n=1 Tax=Mangrovimonas sp. DI 80 TaxID=1779330 RepID=UPI0009FA8F86|nr:ComEC/Rec2 family competence protein [Mangrovimonas sp. DI 80]
MKLLNFTLIKLTVCLILGIVTSYFLHIPFHNATCTTFLGLLLLFILYRISKSKFQQNIWFGATVLITTFFLGSLTYHLHDQKNFKKHYSHHIKNTETKSSLLTLRVREQLKTGMYHDKYVVNLIKIDSIPVQGKALLNIEIDSLSSPFKVDDIIVTQSTLKDIIPPLNPNQFDYTAYLEKQYIYHQLFTNNQEIFTLNSKPYTLLGYAASIREHILSKLNNIHLEKDDFAILSALLLGQRQNIDPITYEQFSNAGVIHILAISGLHIGIILLILNFVLKPFDHLPKGRFYKTILILIMLWGFVIITGLSASVTRAVTMFSVLAIGMNLKRPSNIYNSIAVSVFILLLCKPLFIFDVGFQLSYLAVIAIVSIQPLLYKVYKPKTKLDKSLWNVITVTIAAQIGVLPLSIYYFHQFPLLFFVSNLLVIPILGLVLSLGIVIIILSLLNTSYSLFTEAFHYLITYMQSVIAWTADKEDLIIRDIPLSVLWFLLFTY